MLLEFAEEGDGHSDAFCRGVGVVDGRKGSSVFLFVLGQVFLIEQDGFLFGHFLALGVDGVLNGAQDFRREGFGEDFVGPLEGIDAVDEVDAEVVQVDELPRDLQELAAVLVGYDFGALERSGEDKVLAQLLLLFRGEFRITLLNNLGDERLGDDLGNLVAGEGLFDDVAGVEGGLEFGKVVLYNGLDTVGCFLEAFDMDGALVGLIAVGIVIGVFFRSRAELPFGLHHLFHQEGGCDGLEHIVHGVLDIILCRRRARNEVGELGVGLAFAVTGATSDNLDDLGEGCADADGEAAFAPLPIEAFLRGTQGNEDVEGIGAVHPVEVGLQGVTLAGIVFHKVAYFQGAAIRSLDHLDVVLGVFTHHGTDAGNDVGYLVIFAGVRRTGVHVGDVNEGLLMGVEGERNGRDVFALIELIPDAQALEILVTVELLVVVVGNGGLELGFVFGAHHGNGVAPEVGAGHCHYVGIGAADDGADGRAQVIEFVGRSVVEFVNADKGVIEQGDVQILERVAEGGMGADQDGGIAGEEVDELLAQAAFFEAGGAEVVAFAYFPVGKEAVGNEFRVLEGAGDGFLRDGYDDTFDALVGQLVEGYEHQGAALAGCGRSLDQQVLAGACRIDDALHFPHSEGVGGGGNASLAVLDLD